MAKLKNTYILIVFLIIIFISFLFVSRVERFSATYLPFDPTNQRTWPEPLVCIVPISVFEQSAAVELAYWNKMKADGSTMIGTPPTGIVDPNIILTIKEKCPAIIKYCNLNPTDKKCPKIPEMSPMCQKYPGPFCTAAQGWNTASPSFSMNDIQMNTMGAAMGAFDAAMGAGTNAYNTYTPVSQNTVFSGSICNRLQAYENGCRGP